MLEYKTLNNSQFDGIYWSITYWSIFYFTLHRVKYQKEKCKEAYGLVFQGSFKIFKNFTDNKKESSIICWCVGKK